MTVWGFWGIWGIWVWATGIGGYGCGGGWDAGDVEEGVLVSVDEDGWFLACENDEEEREMLGVGKLVAFFEFIWRWRFGLDALFSII